MPSEKKRKHKKGKRSSPSRSSSYSSYKRHKKRSEKNRTPSRSRSRDSRKRSRKRSNDRHDDAASSAQGFPNMFNMGMVGNSLMNFQLPQLFNAKLPAMPQFPAMKPKVPRTMKAPKTQFKGRLYIPYTFDYAMLVAADPMMPKDTLPALTKNVVKQMEKRASEQKQDEAIIRKITLLGDEIIVKKKVKQIQTKSQTDEKDGKSKLSLDEGILKLSEASSLNDFIQNNELDSDLTEMIGKVEPQVEVEKPTSALMKEAKELLLK